MWPPLDLATRQFIANINLIIKQCYHPVWSEKKYRKKKWKGCEDKKRKNNAFIKMCSV